MPTSPHPLMSSHLKIQYQLLAHVLEHIVELVTIFVGMSCGYRCVETLTDASVRNCGGDITLSSVMAGVPAVWESIRKDIVAKNQFEGVQSRKPFSMVLCLCIPVLAQLANTFVLSKLRAATRGRLYIALSGDATISRDTQDFDYFNGHGMTVLRDVCHPSTSWANEIRIRRSSSLFHRNQITRLSGWRVPRE